MVIGRIRKYAPLCTGQASLGRKDGPEADGETRGVQLLNTCFAKQRFSFSFAKINRYCRSVIGEHLNGARDVSARPAISKNLRLSSNLAKLCPSLGSLEARHDWRS